MVRRAVITVLAGSLVAVAAYAIIVPYDFTGHWTGTAHRPEKPDVAMLAADLTTTTLATLGRRGRSRPHPRTPRRRRAAARLATRADRGPVLRFRTRRRSIGLVDIERAVALGGEPLERVPGELAGQHVPVFPAADR